MRRRGVSWRFAIPRIFRGQQCRACALEIELNSEQENTTNLVCEGAPDFQECLGGLIDWRCADKSSANSSIFCPIEGQPFFSLLRRIGRSGVRRQRTKFSSVRSVKRFSSLGVSIPASPASCIRDAAISIALERNFRAIAAMRATSVVAASSEIESWTNCALSSWKGGSSRSNSSASDFVYSAGVCLRPFKTTTPTILVSP